MGAKGQKEMKASHSPVRERWTGPGDANNHVPALGQQSINEARKQLAFNAN